MKKLYSSVLSLILLAATLPVYSQARVVLDSYFNDEHTKDASGKLLPMGLLEGHSMQVVYQLGGVLISWVLAIVGTLVILKICDAVFGVRVSPEEERDGLDLAMHGEEGYFLES